jgi:hypothetical protein
VYKTLDAKQSIIDEMNGLFPALSKKLIERMIRELTVREKRDGDERIVYHATPQCWSDLTVD